MPDPAPRPIRVAIVNDYPIVVNGISSMLTSYVDRVVVVEMDLMLPRAKPVDVVLYDTFGRRFEQNSFLLDLVRETDAKVVIYTWAYERDAVDRAMDEGALGYLSKGLSAERLVRGIEAVHAGRRVIGEAVVRTDETEGAGQWPGIDLGLSYRESEMLAYIAQGLGNQEIADVLHLSINSVKTYVRNAYRKVGVTSRSQAVVFAMQNGFVPRRTAAQEEA